MSNLPDSGTRQVYGTGAQRDNRSDKGRFDLISPYFLTALAQRLEAGALKYNDRNWEKGMPLGRYIDAAYRHLGQLLMGDNTEDHAAAVAFNIMAYIHTERMIEMGLLPEELDDMPDYEGWAEIKAWNEAHPVESYLSRGKEDIEEKSELDKAVEARLWNERWTHTPLWDMIRDSERVSDPVSRLINQPHGDYATEAGTKEHGSG
jgi:hypothetical protein